MKKSNHLGVAGWLLAMCVTTIAIGCSDDRNATGGQNNATNPSLALVSPAGGATNVARATTISMRFTTSMDTNSVMGAFHLSGGPEMALWMDSVGHHQGMGGMGMMNMDHMMQWMDSVEYSGQWHWNAAKDSCWFVPDSMLMSDADHMIYMYGTVRSQGGMMMDMDTMQYGGLMTHFHTQP